MGQFIPDYLMREQTMVGALGVFIAVRMLSLALGSGLDIKRTTLNRAFWVLALLYCMPEVSDVLLGSYRTLQAWPVIEGKGLGCAVAYVCGSVLQCRLRWHA